MRLRSRAGALAAAAVAIVFFVAFLGWMEPLDSAPAGTHRKLLCRTFHVVLAPAVIPGRLQFDRVVNIPSANDYNRSAWSADADANHRRAAADAERGAGTAEVISVLSASFVNPNVCFLVESAVRMGYNVTLLTAAAEEDFSKHAKEHQSALYGKLQRELILYRLGHSDTDPSTLSIEQLEALKGPKRNSTARRALQDHLKRHNHVYVFSDAFDVIFQLPPWELHRKLRQLAGLAPASKPQPTYFVTSGEANLSPFPTHMEWPRWFPDRNIHLFPFLNSGLWVARLDHMIAFTEYVYRANYSDCSGEFSFSDQCKMNVAARDPTRLFRVFPITIDVNAVLFQSMFPHRHRRTANTLTDPRLAGKSWSILFHPASHLGMTPEGLLSRRDIENTPIALHWNGYFKRFNHFKQLESSPLNVTAVDHTVYKALSWLRRETATTERSTSYFHLTAEQLRRHVTVYNEELQVDPGLHRSLESLCTGGGLRRFMSSSNELLSTLGLLLLDDK